MFKKFDVSLLNDSLILKLIDSHFLFVTNSENSNSIQFEQAHYMLFIVTYIQLSLIQFSLNNSIFINSRVPIIVWQILRQNSKVKQEENEKYCSTEI